MNYTLHQLQVFLTVCQTQSITKAAEMLHLTQPAVSIQMKNFQDQFDIPLTEIIGRRLYVTDFGNEIARAARVILDEVHSINDKTVAYKGQLSGRLRISTVSTGKYVIPYFLAGFTQANEHVELQLDVTNKAGVIRDLENNEVDFSLVSVLPDHLKIDKEELLQNRLYLVGNSEHAVYDKPLDRNSIQQIPLIYREAGSGTRQVMEQFLLKKKIPVRKKMELNTNEAVKQAVMAGMGCSIMPLIGIRNELAQGDLHIIPAKGFPVRSSWYLIWLRDKKFSPAARAYLNYLRHEKEQVMEKHFGWLKQFDHA